MKRHGNGKITFFQGSTLEGEFSNDELINGTFTDKNIFTYTGEFHQSTRQG